jgi:hypothetical protein
MLDAAGTVVGESLFHANGSSGALQIDLTPSAAFSAIEITAGVYNGNTFVYGGYALADGSFGSGPTTDAGGTMHGSEFMVDAVEFKLPVLGVPTSDA